jgi:hypothetical protein
LSVNSARSTVRRPGGSSSTCCHNARFVFWRCNSGSVPRQGRWGSCTARPAVVASWPTMFARELGWVRDPVPCTAQEWARYGRSAVYRRNAPIPDVTTSAASPSLLLFPQVPGLHSGVHGRRHASVERSDDPLPDGLYGVTRGQVRAGFEVRRGVVVAGAPILRDGLTSGTKTSASAFV